LENKSNIKKVKATTKQREGVRKKEKKKKLP